MDFRLLGVLELFDDDGREVAIGSGRQRALLALLLLRRNELVPSDVLIGELWGEAPPPTAQKMLHNQVAALRRALGAEGRLETGPGGYRLRLREGELDVDRFEALVARGREYLERDPQAAAEVFGEALGLWRGAALAGLAYEPFAQTEVGRLEERRLVAFEGRVEAELALGRHADLVAELEAVVAEQPLRERLQAQLMLALYRCGRQAEALEAYRSMRETLVEQLGIEPSPELRELHQAILTHDPELEAPQRQCRLPAPPGATLPRALGSPADAPFVAREPELARLRELWAEASAGGRVAAIVAGDAGIGKTRLAAELARVVDGMGGLVLYGRCDQDLAVPYQPFVEALRPVVRAMGRDRLKAELGVLAAELPRLLPELGVLGEPTRADPETERFAMFEAVSALGEVVTRGRPALFVLDDLHWAAVPTLLLLRHLIRSERSQRALFLGTYPRHRALHRASLGPADCRPRAGRQRGEAEHRGARWGRDRLTARSRRRPSRGRAHRRVGAPAPDRNRRQSALHPGAAGAPDRVGRNR